MKGKKLVKKVLRVAAVGIFWLIVWKLVSLKVGVELIFPSPEATFRAFSELALNSDFYRTMLMSIARIAAGFVAGVLLGMILGVTCAFAPLFDLVFAPLRSVVKATPVSSFILLLLFWFDREYVPSCISMLIVLPVVHSSVYEGLKNTDRLLIEMAEFYRVPKIKQLFTIYAESVQTRLLAACTTSLGLAWKAGIAAEVLATPVFSIGRNLYESKIYLETPQLFAWTVLVILLSIALEKLMLLGLKLLQRRTGK